MRDPKPHHMKIFEYIDLSGIERSGQCFRWKKVQDNTYSFIVNGSYLKAEQCNGGIHIMSDSNIDANLIKRYFDLDTNYDKIIQQSDRDDEYLQRAIEKFHGIKILRQDLWETIVSFIISQRKTIPSIRKCVDELCAAFGVKIQDRTYAFPTPEAISNASLTELRECRVGYRDSYIKAAADWFLQYRGNNPSYSDLLEIPGVGPKVANCIRLFGTHDLSACPIDTWMKHIIDNRYNGKLPKWMDSPYAGVYQQYAFMYERYLNGALKIFDAEFYIEK